MVAKSKGWIIVIAMLLIGTTYGQQKRTFPFVIRFQNQVGQQFLHLDSSYTNGHSETFTVRNFRYYVSHFLVQGMNGRTYSLPGIYFLIDECKPESKTVLLQIPVPTIKALHFDLGVDSCKNVSGVQTGTLDPANGMFWTWNSGYIFAKLEGTSPQAKAPQKAFTYHIGGFRARENAVRKVVLPLQKGASARKDSSLVIVADINAWFSGSHPFKIAEQASIMTPGTAAMQVADNYSRMFSVAGYQ